MRCPHCQAELETPLACAGCGDALAVPAEASPFEILALPLGYSIDRAELKKRLSRFGRLVHPDFFATRSPEALERAEFASARLNAAHATLADDAARAEWLVRYLGGPDAESERELPRAFLIEVLEWNEELEQLAAGANAPGAAARLDALASNLAARRAENLAAIQRLLVPLPARGSPALSRVRQELNALRYLDRALDELEALRSGNPARR
ncbi:MAG: hypothetical protein IPJ77_13770 [Planctomycetes bacterium]|nr:hypothetical protein [Planctomycetota bacterium]